MKFSDIIFFSPRRTKSGGTYRLGSVRPCVRACVRACVRVCVRSCFSDMAGPILLKLDTKIMHYGIHMHVNLFCDLIQYGRLTAILFFFTYFQL